MGIHLLVDTCCDLTKDEIGDVADILPIAVYFDGKEYLPGINMDNNLFYDLLSKATKLPKTSCVPINTFAELMEKYTKNGDEVIGLFMASKMSGTYNSARLAMEMVGSDKISVLDSKTVTFPYGALVLEAVKMIREKKSRKEIVDRLNYLIPRTKLLAMIDDLSYLKMGGRISGALCILGNFLNFKPIININDGVIGEETKKRGAMNAFMCIADELNHKYDVDYSLPSYLGHTNSPLKAEKLGEILKKNTKLNIAGTIAIGPSVGTHVGPGSTGIAFFVK